MFITSRVQSGSQRGAQQCTAGIEHRERSCNACNRIGSRTSYESINVVPDVSREAGGVPYSLRMQVCNRRADARRSGSEARRGRAGRKHAHPLSPTPLPASRRRPPQHPAGRQLAHTHTHTHTALTLLAHCNTLRDTH